MTHLLAFAAGVILGFAILLAWSLAAIASEPYFEPTIDQEESRPS